MAHDTTWAIETAGLGRSFGAHIALRDVTLRVAWGERVAVLGPNGAGKSTLLRVLATLTPPGAGQVWLAGRAPQRHKAWIRQRLGLVAHQTYLFGTLTALENLIFYGRLYSIAEPGPRARQLLARVGLAARANERVRQLSRGMQQRLALARALLHEPDILLLDEPDTGLDQEGCELLASIVSERTDRTVVLTTHHVERAAALCQRAIVLVRGRVVRDIPTSGLSGDLVRDFSPVTADSPENAARAAGVGPHAPDVHPSLVRARAGTGIPR